MPEDKNTFGLRLLFVEDTAESVEAVIDEVRRQFEKPTPQVVKFEDAERALKEFAPHLVVLDLRQGVEGGEQVSAGLTTLNYIWKHRFCPVIVYSAVPDEFQDDEKKKHPLLES